MIAAATRSIVEPGKNCWRVDRADRFLCIQDAADYFALVRRALLAAQSTVFILGWDILASVDLAPGASSSDGPTELGALVKFLARRNPRLQIYILIWDYGSLYTLERDPFSRWRFGWRMPRNVKFGFDDRHPIDGCHHQKVVVIDDALAFCGGVDLTGHRWDTSSHRLVEPDRVSWTTPYGPYHEMHAMMSGPIAASLGVLSRDRWRAVGAQKLPPVSPAQESAWPREVAPDFSNANVAIARTMPASEADPGTRECEALFADSIARAERLIYIESQYFTNDHLADMIAARLATPTGPDVVIVVPRQCEGWLERNTMGARREAVFRSLLAADAHGRLRIVCPIASQAEDVATFIHSKATIIDDTLLRIGSANFSRRSMGVDTECDVAVDAAESTESRKGIERVFHRLLGEHLGLAADVVARGVAEAGSVPKFIDARAGADRTLVKVLLDADDEGLPAALQDAADPGEPMQYAAPFAALVPQSDAATGARLHVTHIVPAVVLAAALTIMIVNPRAALELDDVVDAARQAPVGLLAAAAAFVLASVLLIPVELLAIVAGVFFGLTDGAIVALGGSLTAAAVGYVVGRSRGPAGVSRWIGASAYRSARQLGAAGIGGVLALRLTSVASARSVDLLCGAGRVGVADYTAATIAGLTPAIAVLAGVGALLRRAILQPSMVSVALAVGAAVAVVAAAAVLRTLLLTRRFASSVERHRAAAEFG